jgi:choline dehydrogenase
MRALPETHDWGYRGRGAEGQLLAFERAQVLGGWSAHNGCAQLCGWRGDYDAGAAPGCPGWSSEELRPRFARSSDLGYATSRPTSSSRSRGVS